MDVPDDSLLTEAQQAEDFARLFQDQILFDVATKGWIVFEGGRWRPDTRGTATRLAVDAARELRKDALYTNHHETAKRILAFAKRCESSAGIDAVLKLAKAHLAVPPGQWDRDPLLIGCPNGVFDLHDGSFRSPRPQDRLLLSVRPDFNENAQCPRWVQFMEEIFQDDEDTITYAHRVVGYWLTGQTDLQTWWLLLGGGSNGKSLFFGTIAYVLGSYAKSLPLSAVISSGNRSATGDDLAGLANIRFCYIPETIEEARLDDARLKALTGCDTIAVRHLYGKWFDLQPSLKLVLSANRPPAVKDSSHGFWRRVKVIPFERRFEGADQDPGLKEKLQAEAAGILNWMIEGYADWSVDGLETPESVRKATQRYEQESDHLRDFIAECCDVSPDGTLEHLVFETLSVKLYDAYKWWTAGRHILPKDVLTMTTFGNRLSEQYEKKHTRAGQKYFGLRVRPDVERKLNLSEEAA